jgi:hypothetical protein
LDPLRKRASGLLAAFLALGLAILAIPVVAAAATVSLRVESAGGPLVPRTTVTTPAAAVLPPGASADQTCPANSVIGALDVATGGNWSGTWSDQAGWSIDRIGNVFATPALGRRWVTYINRSYVNDSACHATVSDNDTVIIYPLCTTSFLQCFSGAPLVMTTLATSSPGVRLGVQVMEITTTFSPQGVGTSEWAPSIGASVVGPLNTAVTDNYYGYGYASVDLADRGPNTVSVRKAGFVPDRTSVCVTDGNDGFCGSPSPGSTPFNPYNFCDATGNDGLCGTTDLKPPTTHITEPVNAKKYAAGAHPRFLKGVTDFDASEVKEVRLRLMRKSRVTATKTVKKRVVVKKKVHGKVVRKRVLKKTKKRVKVTRCYSWKIATSTWAQLKACNLALVPPFNADGTVAWSFEFLQALPTGTYTLSAMSVDGVGNVETQQTPGLNFITFTAS